VLAMASAAEAAAAIATATSPARRARLCWTAWNPGQVRDGRKKVEDYDGWL
jgi:hypothetical protein